MSGESEETGGPASPPCSLHEIDPAFAGLDAVAGPGAVAAWRRATRERLVAARLALPADERVVRAGRIAARLEAEIGPPAGIVVALYWPIRGEPDLRPLMARLVEAGATVALPVAARPAAPLVFREWRPGARMTRGIWSIPVPAEGARAVTPSIVVAPVVGFDPDCFRLGNGGGYFDRTLAGDVRPRTIGVGYREAALPTIHPQPHDVPMDCVVTDAGVVRPGSAALQP